MKFLLETHCHTKETSWCGTVSARKAIEEYKAAGYDGVVITDHFHSQWFDVAKENSWEDKLDRWLSGYSSAVETGDRLGVSVFLGMEIRAEGGGNEYLLYGAEPDFVLDHQEIQSFDLERLFHFAEEHDLFLSQAHPFREGMIPADPAFLHGLEVYNGNPRHQSRNHLALEYANKHGLVRLSGSDYHQPEDLARGGLYLPRKPESSGELADMLRNNQISELVRK